MPAPEGVKKLSGPVLSTDIVVFSRQGEVEFHTPVRGSIQQKPEHRLRGLREVFRELPAGTAAGQGR